MTPRRHTAWPPDRGWPAILDSQYAGGTKPSPAHSPPQHSPQLLRRAPIRSESPNYWLAVFGAASGLFWDGLLSSFIAPGWWMLAPIAVGALIGAIFAAS